MHRIVVIGGGTTGTTAAFYARRTSRNCEIIVVEQERYPMYSRCELPFAISGEVPAESPVEFLPELYERSMKVMLLLNTEVVEVDPSSKRVVPSADGRIEELSFDKLIAKEERHHVVGVQAAGASWQVDLAAISMMHSAKVEDLAYLEICYAPALTSIWSPLSAAAQALLRKLR